MQPTKGGHTGFHIPTKMKPLEPGNMGGFQNQNLRVLQISNHLSKQTGLLTIKEEALKFKLFQITMSKERLLPFRPCENSNCKLALSRFS
jgi:hypothetical protein